LKVMQEILHKLPMIRRRQSWNDSRHTRNFAESASLRKNDVFLSPNNAIATALRRPRSHLQRSTPGRPTLWNQFRWGSSGAAARRRMRAGASAMI
jgi:hypothetical protein